jgi:hypothetical protein
MAIQKTQKAQKNEDRNKKPTFWISASALIKTANEPQNTRKEGAECGFEEAIRQNKNAFFAKGSFSVYFAYSAVNPTAVSSAKTARFTDLLLTPICDFSNIMPNKPDAPNPSIAASLERGHPETGQSAVLTYWSEWS